MLDVGVIGGGTAGSAAALFLARAGHRVTIYERVPKPSAVGAGITLQPTGMHVLARLGLYDEVVRRGSRIDNLVCEDARDKAFIAHLDSDAVMHIPWLSKAQSSVWFYHDYVVQSEAQPGDLAGLPSKLGSYYRQCADEANGIYRA